MRLRAVLLAAFALTSAVPAAAQTQESEAAFTQRIAERFRAALPGYRVTVSGPLTLATVGPQGGEAAQTNLGVIRHVCLNRDPQACEAAIDRFVGAMRAAYAEAEAPIQRTQLRVVVRHRDYCTQLDRAGENSAAEMRAMTRIFPPDLCEVVMIDYPDRMRTLNGVQLGPLGLTADAAWQLAEAQTIAALPQPQSLSQLSQGMIAITDIDYIPSLLVNRDGWRALAATQGELLVAVPSVNMMVIARASAVPDLAGFRRSVRDAFDEADRQISDSVYRWTEQGWVLVE